MYLECIPVGSLRVCCNPNLTWTWIGKGVGTQVCPTRVDLWTITLYFVCVLREFWMRLVWDRGAIIACPCLQLKMELVQWCRSFSRIQCNKLQPVECMLTATFSCYLQEQTPAVNLSEWDRNDLRNDLKPCRAKACVHEGRFAAATLRLPARRNLQSAPALFSLHTITSTVPWLQC